MSSVRAELDCAICLSMLCDPVTLCGCGHSFCRNCLYNALEKARKQCSTCRAPVKIYPEYAPVNVTLKNIIETLYPDAYAARLEEMKSERATWKDRLPLFCMGQHMFPNQPLALHLFEPRYRIMVEQLSSAPPDWRRFGYVTTYAPGVGTIGVVTDVQAIAPLATGAANVFARLRKRFVVREHWVDEDAAGLHFGRIEALEDADMLSVRALGIATIEYMRERGCLNDLEGICLVKRMIEAAAEIGAMMSHGSSEGPASALIQQYMSVLLTGDHASESVTSLTDEQFRYVRREHEVASAVWRNYLLCAVAAVNLMASLDEHVAESITSYCGELPAIAGDVDAVSALSFWVPSVLPLPEELQEYLLSITSMGERLWALLRIIWPKYGSSSVDYDAAGEYVQCGDTMAEIHGALESAMTPHPLSESSTVTEAASAAEVLETLSCKSRLDD